MKRFLEEAFYLGTSRALLTLHNGFGLACLSSVFVLPPNTSCQQQRELLLLPKSILEFRAYTLTLSGLFSSSTVWLWAHGGEKGLFCKPLLQWLALHLMNSGHSILIYEMSTDWWTVTVGMSRNLKKTQVQRWRSINDRQIDQPRNTLSSEKLTDWQTPG